MNGLHKGDSVTLSFINNKTIKQLTYIKLFLYVEDRSKYLPCIFAFSP